MFQAGAHLPHPAERALAHGMGRLSLRDNTHFEQHEDVGQGERLCGAKRGVNLRGVHAAPGSDGATPGDMSPMSRHFGPVPSHGGMPVASGGDRAPLQLSERPGGRAQPPPGGLTAAAGLAVQPRAQEVQQPMVVDALRRSLRGIFKHC
eukprot:SRR837773.11285.p2 GENE.SRR837773.11285~~SRR837773.11285.p2  ORF type:complete len:164 (-),score=39.52 SRR837773.11285:51-497(-)